LKAQSPNLVMIFTVLSELTSEYNTMTEKNLMIRQLEHKCDNFTHRLFTIIVDLCDAN